MNTRYDSQLGGRGRLSLSVETGFRSTWVEVGHSYVHTFRSSAVEHLILVGVGCQYHQPLNLDLNLWLFSGTPALILLVHSPLCSFLSSS